MRKIIINSTIIPQFHPASQRFSAANEVAPKEHVFPHRFENSPTLAAARLCAAESRDIALQWLEKGNFKRKNFIFELEQWEKLRNKHGKASFTRTNSRKLSATTAIPGQTGVAVVAAGGHNGNLPCCVKLHLWELPQEPDCVSHFYF